MRTTRRLTPVLLGLGLLASAAACGDETTAVAEARSNLARVENPAVTDADAAALQQGNAAFAFDLFAKLSDSPGNLFFSPHSISSALAMTYAGARGETATEMEEALHFTLPSEQLHGAFNGLDQSLAERSAVSLPAGESGKPPELHVANAAWAEREYSFLPEYLDVLAASYGAGVRLLDFQGDPDGSRVTINDWVEERTEERIKDLIPAGAIDALTRLVLTNAIYFKASWVEPFNEENTKPAEFHRLDGTTATVDTMHGGMRANYARLAEAQALELPYVGNQVSMLIVLPDEGAFADVEASLDADALASIVDALEPVSATVALPKFTFEWDASLRQPLIDLGMESAFSEAADFSGMDGRGELTIADVIHKSFIAVDEKGTEAAAATAVIIRATSAPEPVEFTADRPFIFLIRDQPTGTVLFMGRFATP